jgi:hypothetical protein
VNREALVRAGGDVLVWGRLHGEVHAGRNKHQGASVSVLCLQCVCWPRGLPTQRAPTVYTLLPRGVHCDAD